MAFVAEILESYFTSLGKAEKYARAQWTFLNGLGPQPNPNDFNLNYRQAQAIRIALAQLKYGLGILGCHLTPFTIGVRFSRLLIASR
jgi:hypothetical protein